MHDIDEQHLIQKAKANDREAQACLISKYSRELYGFLFRMTGNHADTDDLLQEVFINVLQGLSSFRDGTNFRAWIYTVARNRFLNFKRRNRYETLLFKRIDQFKPESPSTEQLSEGLLAEINKALNSLADEYKQVIILFIVEGFSHSEIAEIVGSTEGTVRWRLFEAKKKLKRKLDSLLKE